MYMCIVQISPRDALSIHLHMTNTRELVKVIEAMRSCSMPKDLIVITGPWAASVPQ